VREPPSSTVTVDQLLAAARAGLCRLTPVEAHDATRRGAVIVDVRSDRQRDQDGLVPCARHVPRNVLEWRCDPACPHRDPTLARPGLHLIVMCNEGYQSSLAAATLQQLGLARATDVIGGFQAWRAAGLPVATPHVSRRQSSDSANATGGPCTDRLTHDAP
jgi:rhodanese-related sulfurtransferase